MTREVVLTAKARQQLEAAYDWWAEHRSREQAGRWYSIASKAILSLASDPERHQRSSESKGFAYQLRDAYFGLGGRPSHRIVFTIRQNEVIVLAIRHVAQRELTPDEL
jgi:plasmid stabilization system protein ParE